MKISELLKDIQKGCTRRVRYRKTETGKLLIDAIQDNFYDNPCQCIECCEIPPILELSGAKLPRFETVSDQVEWEVISE